MWRQSMQTKAMAPSREIAAALPSVSRRNAVKASEDISPAAMANSRWRVWPKPLMAGLAQAAHLTRCHGELAMAGLAQAADVTVNRDVIRRVGEDQVRTLRLP